MPPMPGSAQVHLHKENSVRVPQQIDMRRAALNLFHASVRRVKIRGPQSRAQQMIA